jgi:hypothetical protein
MGCVTLYAGSAESAEAAEGSPTAANAATVQAVVLAYECGLIRPGAGRT